MPSHVLDGKLSHFFFFFSSPEEIISLLSQQGLSGESVLAKRAGNERLSVLRFQKKDDTT